MFQENVINANGNEKSCFVRIIISDSKISPNWKIYFSVRKMYGKNDRKNVAELYVRWNMKNKKKKGKK